ncbi:MAG TPA: MarR family transcriptional regulator [Gemmatales bacterium]|nr:MarR family transcriptional regulator [Gemmatales bacterium]HMP60194.1 MarR family transcriptional regulator [Gemmatales bacterium]
MNALKTERGTPRNRPHLAGPEQQFIELWGDMSSWWGVSRTMAEIHGLLYITGAALSAEEIQQRLGISRGNVSMNIRTLVEWGLVRRLRRRGDRKDYFVSLTDVWEMFTVLAQQRKRREIDPIIKTLKDARGQLAAAAASGSGAAEQVQEHARRVDELLHFLLLIEKLGEQFFMNTDGIREAMHMLAEASAASGPAAE